MCSVLCDSSLAPVLLLGIGMLFFVMVLLPHLSPSPGMSGSLLICMVFYEWVFDSLKVLSDFTKQVVVSRRDIGVRKWTYWLREVLGSKAAGMAQA